MRWEPSTRTSTTSPQSQDLRRYRYLETANQNIRTTQPLFATDKTMEGSELYDWSSINLAAMNRYYHTTGTTRPTASASSIRGSLF